MSPTTTILEYVLARRPAMSEAQRRVVRRGLTGVRLDPSTGAVVVTWLDRDGSRGVLVDDLPANTAPRSALC